MDKLHTRLIEKRTYKKFSINRRKNEKFNEVLWKQVDSATGLPANTNYNIFSFLNLPHPENIDVEKIIKQYFTYYFRYIKILAGCRATAGFIMSFLFELQNILINLIKTTFSFYRPIPEPIRRRQKAK